MDQKGQQDKAGLGTLAPEILLEIFELLIPPAWNETMPEPLSLLTPRSVCRAYLVESYFTPLCDTYLTNDTIQANLTN